MTRRLSVTWTSLGTALCLAAGCAHLNEGVVPNSQEGRVYDVGEASLKPIVARWFQERGIVLMQSDDPHVLVSRIRERKSGNIGGGMESPPEANSNPLEARDQGELARALEQERTAQLNEGLREASREFHAEIDEAPHRAFEGALSEIGPKRTSNTTTRQGVWGKDRSLNQEREQWRVAFVPVTPTRTLVRVFKATSTTWDSSADQSYSVGVGSISKTASGQPFSVIDRDGRTEAELAEHLDFAAAVEILGEPRVGQIKPVEVAMPPLSASEGSAAVEPECQFDIGSLTLGPGNVVLLSDLNGTVETARALQGVVCTAMRAGLKVTVGLSMDASEQERLNTFMASNGTPEDRAALLDGPFWRRVYQDGRSSEAMLGLVETIRSWRASGRSIALLALDVDVPGNARTSFMSARVLEHLRTNSDRIVIGLLSNTQASLKPGVDWDASYLPLGYRLLAAGVPLKSFDVAFVEGTQWTCRLTGVGLIRCGEGKIRPGPKQLEVRATPTTRGFIKPFEFRSKEGFDGLVFIGQANASAPARPETR